MAKPESCDTFVVLGDKTADGGVVFGKNSDRPNGEVQEIVHFPAASHPDGSKLSCTFIEVNQASTTHAVVLSKPSWMWGAEMGANEHGLCIGNEAVWTKLTPTDARAADERLLGMDLVRLGLERAKTAREAVDVITDLLGKHGQGGPCSDTEDMIYSNSFLMADGNEAWVLETAGSLSDPNVAFVPDSEVWVAKKFTGGFKNISNCLSIRSDYELKSDNLEEAAKRFGWDGSSPLDFKAIFKADSSPPDTEGSRERCGRELLQKLTKDGAFGAREMMQVLRDSDSEISRGVTHAHPTAGSQISVISKNHGETPSVHWFTGTPDPTLSFFKPFVFVEDVVGCKDTVSPAFPDSEDPAKVKPRFSKPVDRRHRLYSLHESVITSKQEPEILEKLKQMESNCISELEEALKAYPGNRSDFVTLFADCVEAEVKYYE